MNEAPGSAGGIGELIDPTNPGTSVAVPTVYNSILMNNDNSDFACAMQAGEILGTLAYSDVGVTTNVTNGGHNISAPPLFINNFSDLHLLAGSPCIGTGSTNAPYLPATDLDGNPRVVRGKANMGAYSPTTAPLLSTLSPNSVAAGSAATLITITGKNFLLNSGVQFNSKPIATTYISATQLTATIPASLLTVPGSAAITVVNPGPGGRSTNSLTLKVVSNVSVTLNPTYVTGGAITTGTVILNAKRSHRGNHRHSEQRHVSSRPPPGIGDGSGRKQHGDVSSTTLDTMTFINQVVLGN